jgi:hypothetical protein
MGFSEPLFGMNYNPPYYKKLFEDYGSNFFSTKYVLQSTPRNNSSKIHERHDLLAANPDISCRLINKKELEKFAADFTTIYNKAWAGHGGLKQLACGTGKKHVQKMKPVIDERIIYFAYHKSDPIAMFLNLPDLNQYFKYMNGKFGLLQKLYFLYLQKFKPSKKFNGLVFGWCPSGRKRN